MTTKKCVSCFAVKEERQFYKGKTKRFTKCMECHRVEMRRRYWMNRDIIRERARMIADMRKAMRTL